MRMVQRCQNARFALKARHTFAIPGECLRQNLDGHAAPELQIRGLIHVSHPTRTEVAGDLVIRELSSNHDIWDDPRANSIKYLRILGRNPWLKSSSRNVTILLDGDL